VCIPGEAAWKNAGLVWRDLHNVSIHTHDLFCSAVILAVVGLIQIGLNTESELSLVGSRRSYFWKHDENSSSFCHSFAESSNRRWTSARPFSSSLMLA
jgi:hypothetical protein